MFAHVYENNSSDKSYCVYLEQTTHVRNALLMYGGHGKEPQLARTG
jgi:hypothetical protein